MFEEFDPRSQTKILRDDDHVARTFLTLGTSPPMRGRHSLQHANILLGTADCWD